ncbi:MAG: undecaprenyl-phosphate glucose phosphotransferase [Clostridiales bacterium]|nr:undecaprenyl-phosphate glucose phosphotransferase [Clostridiales bacterium]
MIKDNQKFLNKFHIFLDACIIAVSYILAYYIRLESGLFPDEGRLSTLTYFIPLLPIVLFYLVLNSIFHLYMPKRVQGRRVEFANIFKANTLGLFVFIGILYIIDMAHFSRQMIFIFYGINIFLQTLCRNIIRYMLRTFREKGYNLKHVLLVGYSRAAEAYIDRILANPQWGYVIRGILDDNVERGTSYKGINVLGNVDNLFVILPENRLDEIAITLSLNDYSKLEYIVNLCEKSGVHTKFIPDYNHMIPTKPYTEDLLGLPVVNIRHVPLTNTINMVMKRIIDILGAVAALIIFSPVMLLTAIGIKISSPGPIIYSQDRVGIHNRPFKMYKFRSMQCQEEHVEKSQWTKKNDSRVTTIGKLIRSTSIDELPQLYNVLKGDMSLVGPRPERPFYVEKFKEEIPRYMVKHQVRPGMTGWAQINGFRGDTSIRKRIEYDLYYIENWTVGMDFKILFLTVFRGFINKNAY